MIVGRSLIPLRMIMMSYKCLMQGDRHLNELLPLQTLHMLYFLESLGENEFIYNLLEVIDFNEEDQVGQ